MIEHEPHEPIADCDCRECAVAERNRLRQEVTMLRQEYAADTAEIANLNAMLDEHRGVIWASYFYTRQSATGAFRDAKF